MAKYRETGNNTPVFQSPDLAGTSDAKTEARRPWCERTDLQKHVGWENWSQYVLKGAQANLGWLENYIGGSEARNLERALRHAIYHVKAVQRQREAARLQAAIKLKKERAKAKGAKK